MSTQAQHQAKYDAFEKTLKAWCAKYDDPDCEMLPHFSYSTKALLDLLSKPAIYDYLSRPAEEAVDDAGYPATEGLENKLYNLIQKTLPRNMRIPYRTGNEEHFYDDGVRGDTSLITKHVSDIAQTHSYGRNRIGDKTVHVVMTSKPEELLETNNRNTMYLGEIADALRHGYTTTSTSPHAFPQMTDKPLPKTGYSVVLFPYSMDHKFVEEHPHEENTDGHTLCYGLMIDNETHDILAGISANSWVEKNDPYQKRFKQELFKLHGNQPIAMLDLSLVLQHDKNCVLHAHDIAYVMTERLRKHADKLGPVIEEIQKLRKVSYFETMRNYDQGYRDIMHNDAYENTAQEEDDHTQRRAYRQAIFDEKIEQSPIINNTNRMVRTAVMHQISQFYPEAMQYNPESKQFDVDKDSIIHQHNLTKWEIGNARLHEIVENHTKGPARGAQR